MDSLSKTLAKMQVKKLDKLPANPNNFYKLRAVIAH